MHFSEKPGCPGFNLIPEKRGDVEQDAPLMPAKGARHTKLDISLWIGFADPIRNLINEFRRQFGGRLSAVRGRNQTAMEENVRPLLGARLETCHDVSTVGRPKAHSVIRTFPNNLTERLTRFLKQDIGN